MKNLILGTPYNKARVYGNKTEKFDNGGISSQKGNLTIIIDSDIDFNELTDEETDEIYEQQENDKQELKERLEGLGVDFEINGDKILIRNIEKESYDYNNILSYVPDEWKYKFD